MKKSELDENKIYTSWKEIEAIGSTRRKCTFRCTCCHKISKIAVDRLFIKKELVCGKCSRKLTNNERYGGNTPYSSEKVRRKGARTLYKHYGVKNPGQTEQSIKHAKQPKTKEFKEKVKQTNLQKYGCESFSQTEEGRKNISNRFKDKKFVEHRTKQTKKTKLERYGDENYCNKNKIKKSLLKKTKKERMEISEKRKQTCLKKYGVEYTGQIPGINTKKSYQFDGYNFDSSWELQYYKYLKKSNKNFSVHPKVSFEYFYKNKKHYYHPDFLVGKTFVEIKGDHFFKNNKMICPWDKNKNGLYEAKHKCMLKNKVKILTRKNLRKMGIIL